MSNTLTSWSRDAVATMWPLGDQASAWIVFLWPWLRAGEAKESEHEEDEGEGEERTRARRGRGRASVHEREKKGTQEEKGGATKAKAGTVERESKERGEEGRRGEGARHAQGRQDVARPRVPELGEVVLGPRCEQALGRVPLDALDVPAVTCRGRGVSARSPPSSPERGPSRTPRVSERDAPVRTRSSFMRSKFHTLMTPSSAPVANRSSLGAQVASRIASPWPWNT